MSTFPLKPTHKPVKAYFEALATFTKHGHTTEGNTRSAFADLLKRCCPTYGWHLVEEYQFKGTSQSNPSAQTAPSSTTSPSSTASGKPRTPTTTSPKRSPANAKPASDFSGCPPVAPSKMAGSRTSG